VRKKEETQVREGGGWRGRGDGRKITNIIVCWGGREVDGERLRNPNVL